MGNTQGAQASSATPIRNTRTPTFVTSSPIRATSYVGDTDMIPAAEDDLLSASRLREEVTLLEGHTRGAGVRCIVRVDGNIGGDDGMICIWSGGTKPSAMLGGMYLLTTDSSVDDASDGKRAAVMSMLALNANTLIAGYADKTIRVWDLTNSFCCNRFNKHTKPVIVKIGQSQFLSAADDGLLCSWDAKTGLIDNINLGVTSDNDGGRLDVIRVGGRRVATSGLYDVVTLDPNFKFDQSRVSPLKNPKFKSISAISCLGSDERLVCGSSEGRLTCWALETMTLLTVSADVALHDPIESIVCTKNIIVVACGRGFWVFDEILKKLYEEKEAHSARIVKILLLYHGRILVTASEDTVLSLWRIPKPLITEPMSSYNSLSKRRIKHPRGIVFSLNVHANAILSCTALGDNWFASGAVDGLIVTWKDREEELRAGRKAVLAYLSNPGPAVPLARVVCRPVLDNDQRATREEVVAVGRLLPETYVIHNHNRMPKFGMSVDERSTHMGTPESGKLSALPTVSPVPMRTTTPHGSFVL